VSASVQTHQGVRLGALGSSLWFVPAIETIGFALLAVALIVVDRQLYESEQLTGQDGIFRGGVDGSRGILAAVAGSLISAAVTVFSITVVVLQLASSQFTPRVLPSFTGDRRFQSAVGILLGTFVYCLLALWSVGHEEPGREPFVPVVTTAVAIVLALISVAVLILFIHHVSTLIQVSTLVDRVTDETVSMIGKVRDDANAQRAAPYVPKPLADAILSTRAGYLQEVDSSRLLGLADRYTLVVEVLCPIGAFVLPDMPLASVSPAGIVDDALADDIRATLVLAPERMTGNDIEFGVKRVADIAVKALSPGINDPTTAINGIDRLSEIMVAFARRPGGPRTEHGEAGGVVTLPASPSAESIVREAFAQIRHYGAGDVLVSQHLATQLGRAAGVVPLEFAALLALEAALIPVSCEQAGMIAADLQRVKNATAWTERIAGDAGPAGSGISSRNA
jgi:uncharacterized membrane protein